MPTYAPIILFVYNRPEHTRKTLDALLACKEAGESDLFIFADGPKPGTDGDAIAKVRALTDAIYGFKSVTRVYRENNLGLANSVKAGVDDVLQQYDRVIVLEDDIVVSPAFLAYMNGALEVYKSINEVFAISGYSFYSNRFFPKNYALGVMSSWGWGTWGNRWKSLTWDAAALYKNVSLSSGKPFDFAGFSYSKLLRLQVDGAINSWAIQFYANMYLNNGVCIYPGNSLIDNIGFDGTGTHSSTSFLWKEPVASTLHRNPDVCLTKEHRLLRYIVERHISNKRKRLHA
jgi:hypothetical protein